MTQTARLPEDARKLNGLVAALPILVVLGFLPTVLYAGNAVVLGYDSWLVLVFAVPGLAAAALLFGLGWLGLIPRWLAVALWAVGAWILLADVFAPVQLGRLDGEEMISPEPIGYTIAEGALAALVAIFVWRMYRLPAMWRFMSIITACVALGTLCLFIFSPSPPEATEEIDLTRPQSETDLPNIYHFHMDAMRSDRALSAIQTGGLEDAFEGFTFYTQALASYPYTLPSVPSYMTSTVYTGGNILEWRAGFDRGLLADLDGLNYQLDIVGLPEHVQTPLADAFSSPEEIYKDFLSVAHPQLTEFTTLLMARLLPNFLTNESLGLGEAAGRRISGLLGVPVPADIPLTVEGGVHPYQAKLALDQLRAEEAEKSERGRYQYLQAILPHGPFVLDSNCSLVQNVTYTEQLECGITLLVEFLAELKRLQRYDSSIIIIQSDHGESLAAFRQTPSQSEHPYIPGIVPFGGGTKEALEERAMATLMIKPPGSSGPLAASEMPAQLLDLYPTIMGILGVEPGLEPLGVDLISCMADECSGLQTRPRYMYLYPHTVLGAPLYRQNMEFTHGRAVFVGQPELIIPE